MRGGRVYDSAFKTRMKGDGPWADLIRQRFDKACGRLGLSRGRFDLRADLFCAPTQDRPQLDLF